MQASAIMVPRVALSLALQRQALRSSQYLSTAVVLDRNAPNLLAVKSFTPRPSRQFSTARTTRAQNLLPFANLSQSTPSSYFPRASLPANTIVRFVPQQTAWIVERMGKFHRILEPGLAILIPFVDRIAYVKSLKEAAIEIPSQSAITADNVTLDLDGVLFTRVFDAYKAR